MIDGRFVAYVALMGLLIIIPGPDMLMVTRTVLRSGRRAGFVVAWGVAAGIAVWGGASLMGVAVLLERSVLAFTILKVAGGLYLAYLGVRSLLGRREEIRSTPTPALVDSTPTPALPSQEGGSARLSLFGQGVLSNVLNPKAGAIFVTVIPQFIRPGDPPLRWVLMLLAFEVMLVVWLHVYSATMAVAGRSPLGNTLRRGFERVAGAVLIGLGVRLALERR
jgi:threonine/homoserine/homoserine lactone efflux protein